MSNSSKPSKRFIQAQAITQAQHERRFKATTDLSSELESNESPLGRRPFPVWQITMPLCIVLIFAIGALTAYSMVEGRYLFDLLVSREQIRIRTDVDKRDNTSVKEKKATSDKETTEAQKALERAGSTKVPQ